MRTILYVLQLSSTLLVLESEGPYSEGCSHIHLPSDLYTLPMLKCKFFFPAASPVSWHNTRLSWNIPVLIILTQRAIHITNVGKRRHFLLLLQTWPVYRFWGIQYGCEWVSEFNNLKCVLQLPSSIKFILIVVEGWLVRNVSIGALQNWQVIDNLECVSMEEETIRRYLLQILSSSVVHKRGGYFYKTFHAFYPSF